MTHVDLGKHRFDELVPLKDWRPLDPTPSLFGFFIVSNDPDEWESAGPTIRRNIGLFSRADLTSKLSMAGGFEAWVAMWERSLKPGEYIAVGTLRLPGMGWLEFNCTASDIMMRYFVETKAS